MRNTIAFLLVLVPVLAMAQSAANFKQPDEFIPRTLSAGTQMSARTLSSSYSDTTQDFRTRGFTRVQIGLETATNDSGCVLLAYAPSKDGVNFSSYVLFDSLATTGTVGKVKYFDLPADAMGAYSVRVRAYGSSVASSGYSANPSTTITTKIIRKHY